jgi:hypothetical protein
LVKHQAGLVFADEDYEKLEHTEPRGTFREDAGILPLLVPKVQRSDTDMWVSKTPAMESSGLLLPSHLLGNLKISDFQSGFLGSPHKGAYTWGKKMMTGVLVARVARRRRASTVAGGWCHQLSLQI